MKNITRSILAIASAMVLCNCKTTVGELVPPARGTATGDIKVDWLTEVGTVSRITPGSTASVCSPGKNAMAAARGQWATTAEGVTVTTRRISGAEGYNHVASGTGNLLQGGGILTGGIGIARGKLRSNINNNVNSRSGVHLGGCTDPNSPYIYGY